MFGFLRKGSQRSAVRSVNRRGRRKYTIESLEGRRVLAASIGDFVFKDTIFFDADGVPFPPDGVQESTDTPFANVSVDLLDSSFSFLRNTTSAIDGTYSFGDLDPGDYYVRFNKPIGYTYTAQNTTEFLGEVVTDAEDSDADPITGITDLIVLGPDDDPTVDAGFIPEDPGTVDIALEKFTNGFDADLPDGADVPEIAVGDAVDWLYELENTGDADVAFDAVQLVDDNGTPADLLDDLSLANSGITLDAASDVNSDQILSPGEKWEFTASSTAVDLSAGTSGLSNLVTDGTYTLHNHPDGEQAAPGYGLRLDGLVGGNGYDVFTFDFDDPSSDVQMIVDGNEIRITGVAFGGLDIGSEYDSVLSGLWDLDFTYASGVQVVADDAGQTDLEVAKSAAGSNTGTVTAKFWGAASTNPHLAVANGDVFSLVDYDGDFTNTFRLGNGSDDSGHREFGGISGWGWMNHAEADDLTRLHTHLVASDWLFTAVRQQDVYGNTATATVEDITASDSSHYKNPPLPTGAKIGDFVWNDLNKDGQQDPDEPGLADVTVRLLEWDGSVIESTTTDDMGMYMFNGLDAGDYKIRVIAPDGFVFAPQYEGLDENNDSNIDPITGMSGSVWLDDLEMDLAIDAGLHVNMPAPKVTIEAEHYDTADWPWVLKHDCYMKTWNGTGTFYHSPPEGREMTYSFNVDQGGDFEISARVAAPSHSDNSFWITIDDQPWVKWHVDVTNGYWQWQTVQSGGYDSKFNLDAGDHTLRIKVREDGTAIDKIMIGFDVETSTGSAQYIPAGGFTSLADPWELQTDSYGREYITAPNGTGTHWNTPPAGTSVTYDLHVANSDQYYMYGKVLGANHDDNSFWIRVDDGDWVQWHVSVCNGWQWQIVRSGSNFDQVFFDLEAGSHTIEVKLREDGAKLSELYVSNY